MNFLKISGIKLLDQALRLYSFQNEKHLSSPNILPTLRMSSHISIRSKIWSCTFLFTPPKSRLFLNGPLFPSLTSYSSGKARVDGNKYFPKVIVCVASVRPRCMARDYADAFGGWQKKPNGWRKRSSRFRLMKSTN